MSETVLVVNADLTALRHIPWEDANNMVLLGKATILVADPEREIHSQYLSVPFPKVIQLLRYVYIPEYDMHGGMDTTAPATRRKILTRDKHTCIYCGKRGADTIDHIFPQSRGGKDTWANLAAACRKCNGKKADRTPEEAGMKLLWTPWREDPLAQAQEDLWKLLNEEAGVVATGDESVAV